ncbi:ABC transporter permease [Inconstantimicrobium mannanitabidum]|uniref:Antibiotic ABC transporter permease n=1 Tax=Inconstantimicrobium mannanitabidum TaxID=1604901 RepID=A0ACB5RH11_9CLOT|nr:ABC-2 family transporter protein [Clostridium sp. TW13]GKX68384.1 antibiotic ABC transporter permease [Clostridium sp. TW13]
MLTMFRVYWPFAANKIKSSFAYRGRFYLLILGRIFSMFIVFFLWMAIYKNSNGGIIGGFSENEMMLYVFMSYVISGYATIGISDEIGSNIVDGSIAINLTKPLDYRLSLIFKAFGTLVYKFVVPSLFIWIGVEIYRVIYLGIAVTSIVNIALFLLSSLFSFFIYVLFDYLFGMLAFYTTYIFGLNIAKSAVLGILTGQLIPLSFFPEVVQKVFSILPFSSMTYLPVMIYMGKCSKFDTMMIIVRQIVWIIILYYCGTVLWKKATKRLVVLGG